MIPVESAPDEEASLPKANGQVLSLPDSKPYDVGGVRFVPFDPVTSTIDDDFAEFRRYDWSRSLVDQASIGPMLTDKALAPFKTVSMSWRDIRVSVQTQTGGVLPCTKKVELKPILRGVTGCAQPGRMLAIMGGSGAGKSTLLTLLAGRMPAGEYEISGELLVNGHGRHLNTFRRIAGFVEQEDRMFAELTVREQLEISARCRLPASMPLEQKMRRVDQVIYELGLSKVADTKVGSFESRGISGGERKRVSIGIELVTNPPLLLLDEPTSGLDSFHAQAVMLTMLRLAREGRTIIATIHQPRSQIFQMFDDLLLLSEGYQVYLGSAKEMVGYFSQLGYPCPAYYNPADFALDLISLSTHSKMLEEQTRDRVAYLEASFSRHRKEMDAKLDEPLDDAMVVKPKEAPRLLSFLTCIGERKYSARWVEQFVILLRRAWSLKLRNRAIIQARVTLNVIYSIALGLIWLNAGRNTLDDRAVAGVIFYLLVNQSFGASSAIVMTYLSERRVVVRERSSRTYRMSAYFLAKSVTEVVLLVALVLFFSCITYWMVGFQPHAASFFIFTVTLTLAAHAAESLTLVASTSVRCEHTASMLASVLLTFSSLFAGFLIAPSIMPVWLRWIRYISFMFYAFAALMTDQFGSLPTLSSSQDPMQVYNVNSLGIGANIGFLILLAVVYRSIAYVGLLLNKQRFQKSL
ncbi:hypothetical protein F1559_000038 [Cyanidiococcus yangmingshanensis]|uniref:Probable ATP-dependent transporter ycf16 n=1 Tax=Cyanidiococcus yangmingshanensis TaxID=2690220 RepID=A0A7J7IIM9_9RHOD|nr:hypothetical protein F1559_000038 [Cyanidiococcus yangmingshanensis]